MNKQSPWEWGTILPDADSIEYGLCSSASYSNLWILWAVLRVYGDILGFLSDLREFQNSFEADHQSNDPLEEGQKSSLRKSLTKIAQSCRALEMMDANNRIKRIQKVLSSEECGYAVMAFQIKTLHETIEDNLEERRFWYISNEQDKQISEIRKLPIKDGPDAKQALYDWEEAVWCHAFDRHTACIMHLMRLIEVGLRILGRHLDIELKRAIEFEDWRPILEAVDRKLSELSNEARTEERARDLAFYADAASQMRYFKDIWRDPGAHARGRYDKFEAARALERVRHFMTILFEKLDSVS